VRNQARALITVATLGVLAASYQLGTAAETGLLMGMPAATAAPVGSPTESGPVATPVASASASAGVAPTSSSSAGSSTTATKAPSTATKAPAATPTTAPVASAKTATGAAITYKYGTIQLEVTQASGKITDVNVLVGTGSGPQYDSVISGLAAYAINANGSNFGNVSRATFSTNAFKQALDSAIAKL
jgi:uncharacterized protein with FMN-binding domain